MPTYTLQIVVDGKDRASKPLGNVGSALSNIGQIAAGILTAGLLRRIGEGLNNLVTGGINAAASLQLQGLALENLVARELAMGEEIENTVTKVAHLSGKEKERLESLRTDYDVLGARIKETMQKIWERENVWTDKPVLQLNTLKASLADMQESYGDMGEEIAKLENKEGSLISVQETMRINTMDLGEALKLAGPKAAQLLKELRDLSLISPFQYEQIFATYRLQLAYGATTEQAGELTKAVLDTGAALGLDNTMMERLNYNLTQAVVAGDLTAINLRQLKLAGLDLADVFEVELGMSIEEVRSALESGKLTMEDVGQAFTTYANKYFGGAAERMTRTFHGLRQNVKDLFFFAGADTLTPLIEKLTEVMNTAFDNARDFLEEGKLVEFGEKLGEAFEGALDILSPFGQALKELFQGDFADAWLNFVAGLGNLIELLPGMDAEKASDIALAIYEIGNNAYVYGKSVANFLEALGNTVYQTTLEWWGENGTGIITSMEGVGQAFVNLKDALVGDKADVDPWMVGLSPGPYEDTLKFFEKLTNMSLDALGSGIKAVAKALETLVKVGEVGWESKLGWMEEHGDSLNTSLNGIADSLGRIGSVFGDAVDDEDVDKGIGMFGKITGFFLDIIAGHADFGEGITSFFADVSEAIGQFFASIAGIDVNVGKGFEQLMQNLRDGLWALFSPLSYLGAHWSEMKEGVNQLGEMLGFLNDYANEHDEIFYEPIGTVFEDIAAAWKDHLDDAIQVPVDLKDSTIGTFEELRDELVAHSIVPDMIDDIIDEFKRLMKDIPDAVNAKMQNIKDAGKAIVDGLQDGISDQWDEFIDWLLEKMGGISGDILGRLLSGEGGEQGGDVAGGTNSGANDGIGGGMVPAHATTYNVYINDRAAASFFLAQIESQRARKANAFMGG